MRTFRNLDELRAAERKRGKAYRRLGSSAKPARPARVNVTLAPPAVVPVLPPVSVAPRAVGPAIDRAPVLRSERYLNAVREMGCSFCNEPGPSDPHHFPPRGSRGTADIHTLPVCRRCHDKAQQYQISRERQAAAVHQTQRTLYERRGALWWLGCLKEMLSGMEELT
jgi:hypothetical protein